MTKKKISASPAERGVTDGRDNGGEQPIPVMPVSLQEIDRLALEKRGGTIDPATRDQLYSDDDIQFMTAMDYYKRDNRRPFPTWSEALEVLHSLGYRKVAAPTPGLNLDVPPKAEGSAS